MPSCETSDHTQNVDPVHLNEVGTIEVGPLRQMGRSELLSLMDEHSLTTGFDIGIRLRSLGNGMMSMFCSGREIPGYFLEKNGFGMEACEEDVEGFLLDATCRGTVVSVMGQSITDKGVAIVSRSSHVRSDKSISTSAIRHLRNGDAELPIMVTSNVPRSRLQMAVRYRANHLHLVPKVEHS
ncbi:hypothetical protein [Paracoccus sp. ME4]|uniref:hypothetical protein n=1 Tax=Paracoccus sp. ME4 TaxID=3138066 RepID=UPI00398B64D7